MAVKAKVLVTRIIPEVGLNRIKEHCDTEVWSDPLPPPHAVLRQKVAQHIKRYIIADQVELEDVTDNTAAIAVEGPGAESIHPPAGSETSTTFTAPFSLTGQAEGATCGDS